MFRPGIYVAVFYFTPGTKSILLDMNGNLPAAFVGDEKLSADLMAGDAECSDMVCRFGWVSGWVVA